MAMHLLRKASISNSDKFGRYEIRKLRGTFPIVIFAEQAVASNIPSCVTGFANQQKVQSLLSWQPVSALYLANQAHGTLKHHSRYGNSTP